MGAPSLMATRTGPWGAANQQMSDHSLACQRRTPCKCINLQITEPPKD